MDRISLLSVFSQSLVYPITSGFILGTLVGPLVPSMFAVNLAGIIAISLVIWAISTGAVYKNDCHFFSKIFVVAVMLLASIAGVYRFWFAQVHQGDPLLKQYVGEYVRFSGTVNDDPVEGETTTRITLLLRQLNNRLLSTPTKIIFSIPPYMNIAYGNEIQGTGILEKPTAFQTDTGGTFSYDTYLAAQHIFYTLIRPTVHVVAIDKGNPIKATLFNFKKIYMERLATTIPFPESRLAAALTIAGKEALPIDVRNDFLRAGVIPIVVLSGFHVIIVAETIAWIVTFVFSLTLERIAPFILVRILKFVTILSSIILFCLMAGAAASIVRGAIMAGAVITAKLFQQRYSVHRALWISAFFMLLVNPLLTAYDTSFQFSFIAMAGLIYGGPIFSRAFSFLSTRWNIRQIVSSTTAAQCFVAPFALYTMGQCSVVVVLTNLLIFFSIPLAMFASFVTALVAFFSPLVAAPFAIVAWVLLAYDTTIVHFLALVPFGFWEFPPIPIWTLVVAYCGIIFFTLRWYTKSFISSSSKDSVRQLSNSN